MEELQVIETTSGRQFKPWASREDVQAIKQETVQAVVQAVAQAVQDPASITAVTSEIASGKQAIAEAINARGGSASLTDSFNELAQEVADVTGIAYSDVEWLDGHKPSTLGEAYDLTYLVSIKSDMPTVGTGQTGQNSGTNLYYRNICVRGLQYLKKAEFRKIKEVPWRFFNNCYSLEEVICPEVSTIGSDINTSFSPFKSSPNIKNIVLGTLTSAVRLMTIGIGQGHQRMDNLRNITIGFATNIDLIFSYWTATNVIAEGQSGIDELNTNIVNNIVPNLYEGGGKTMTVYVDLYNVLTAETLQAIQNKGWNVASASL